MANNNTPALTTLSVLTPATISSTQGSVRVPVPSNFSPMISAQLATAAAAPQAQAAVGMVTPQGNHKFTDQASIQSANVLALPNSFQVSIANASTADTVAYIFNRASYQNVTSNLTYSYQSGTYGDVLLTNIVSNCRGSLGAVVYGMVLQAYITSSGAADSAGAARMNPFFLDYTTYGTTYPLNITLDGQTRKDFSDQVYTVSCIKNVGHATQFGITVPALDTVSIIFYFDPSFSK